MKTVLLFLILPFFVFTQNKSDSLNNDSTKQEFAIDFVKVTTKPIYPGCEGLSDSLRSVCFGSSLTQFITENFELPEEARKNGIYGRIYVQFTIDTEGNITNVKILKGSHKLLNEAAVECVKKLPQMTPGVLDGTIVPVSFVVPINVQKQSNKSKKKNEKEKRKLRRELKKAIKNS